MAPNKKTFESLIREKLESYEMKYNHSDWLKLEKDLPSIPTDSSGKSSGSILKIAAIIGITAIAVISIVYMLNQNNPIVKSICNNTVKETTNNTIATTQQNTISDKQNNNQQQLNNTVVKENSIQELEQGTVSTKGTSDQNMVSVSPQVITNSEIKSVNKTESNNVDVPNGNSNVPVVMFAVDNIEGCAPFRVTFIPSLKDDSFEYLWDFGNGETSTLQKPVFTYENEGSFNTKLTVKNKKTNQSSTFSLEQPILVKLAPVTDFIFESNSNVYTFTNRTINTSKIKWQLGNGEESTDEIVKQTYKINGYYNIVLIATGINGCVGTANKEIKIDVFAHIFFPTAFTPDGDGRNDYFGPIAENLSDYQFEMAVYNRIGQLMFETKDAKIQWNGKIKGTEKLADPGVYVFEAIFKDKYSNTIRRTGSVSLTIK